MSLLQTKKHVTGSIKAVILDHAIIELSSITKIKSQGLIWRNYFTSFHGIYNIA